MSLIQAYITRNFILVGGDTRGTNGDIVVSNDVKKVFKINKNIIIGMSGKVNGNCILFKDIIEFTDNKFKLKDVNFDQLTYKEFTSKINESYYNNNDYLQENSIHSIVCGYNGERLMATTYITKDANENFNKPVEIFPLNETDVRVINCGEEQHYLDAFELKDKINALNILQFKNLFNDVLQKGIKYDNTINNNADFEVIRLKDVII